MVSMPSDSGITSSSSQSSPAARLPASRLAWMAAPSATTRSGSRLLSGSRPKYSPTAFWICGMRVAPPTITTPFTSSGDRPASRSALRVGPRVFCTSIRVISVKISDVSLTSTNSPVDSLALIGASPCTVRYSLASRARVCNSRASCGETGESFAASMIQQKTR